MELGGPQSVKVLSPEILSLLDRAQALCIAEGNTPRRENGECRGGARGRRPVHASHCAVAVTREIHAALPRGVCLSEPKRRAGQMAAWKSDRCVVPMKPGNSGGGKAARPSQRAGCGTGRTQGRSSSGSSEGMLQGCDSGGWWRGAGCVKCARPVLRGGRAQSG